MDRMHFVVTSEQGSTKCFAIKKIRFKITLSMTLVFLVLFSLAGVTGINSLYENHALKSRVDVLAKKFAATSKLNQTIQEQAASKEREQKLRLQTALGELRERSHAIEAILNVVGIDVAVKESRENTGGPYNRLGEDSLEDLTFKVDHYLETIKSVPLGPPVPGVITSRFGRRVDPINEKAAFHSGVDIKNRLGTPIKAPAAGKVVGCGHTRGYGNFVEIDHGNGFMTKYLHMKKVLVGSGEKVKRGQVIGLLGNTGRSTGPHLHYEIHYRDKAINPIKFVRIAKYLKNKQ